jgi:WD40 repeat protein
MNPASDCPTAHDLERLLTGQMPEEEAGPLERHLEGCGSCQQAARGMPAADALAEAVSGCAAAAALQGYARPDTDVFLRRVRRTLEGRTVAGGDAGDDRTPMSGDGATTEAGEPQWFDPLLHGGRDGEGGRLGPFRVRGVLGAGGMGVVFRAEDPRLRRPVALKVMRPALAVHVKHRRRFLREARAAAAVESDHVVRIYQVGEDRGVPFLAMELLNGETLQARLRREGRVAPAEAARVAREAALGLAAAHARGLTHRDVKPGNLWLEAGTGRVKILDFGLAHVADDDALLTDPGDVVGTPAYMAPEQARGEPGAAGASADVYALGVVLYRMLTGQEPYAGPSLRVIRRVGDAAPPPPSRLCAGLDRRLEAVVNKAMARRPQDRFAGAAELAEALGRWLRGADPFPSRRPRRLLRAAAAALILAGVALLAQQVIVRIRDKDGRVVFEVKVPEGGSAEVVPAPVPAPAPAPGPGAAAAKPAAAPRDDERRPDPAGGAVAPPAPGVNPSPAAPPEPPKPAPAGGLGHLDHLRPEGVPAQQRLVGVPGLVATVGRPGWRHWYSEGGRGVGLAFGEGSKDLFVWTSGAEAGANAIRLWGAETGRFLGKPFERPPYRSNAWVPGYFDGKTAALLSGGDGSWSWRLWDVTSRTPLATLWARGPVPTCLALSRDGKRAASGTADGTLLVWDLPSGEPAGSPVRAFLSIQVDQVAFAPGSGVVAAAAVRNDSGQAKADVVVWELGPNPRELVSLPAHFLTHVDRLAFSADGRTLAVHAGPPRNRLQLWDVSGWQRRSPTEWAGQTCFAFSPDGKTLARGGAAGEVLLCDASGRELRALRAGGADVTCAVFSPDGQRLATASQAGGDVRLWDVASGRPASPAADDPGAARSAALSPDGGTVAVAAGGVVFLWDPSTRKQRGQFLPPEHRRFTSVAFSPDGRWLAAGIPHLGVQVWDAQTHEQVADLREQGRGELIGPVAFSPGGDLLACGNTELSFSLWRSADGGKGWKYDGAVHNAKDGRSLGSCVAFAPGRDLLATAGAGAVRLWDLKTGVQLACLEPRQGAVGGLAFSSDGMRLVCGTADGALLVWDLSDPGKPQLMPANGRVGAITDVAYGNGGGVAYSVGEDGRMARWVWSPAARVWEPRGSWSLPGPVYGLALSADRRFAVTANGDGTAYVLRLADFGEER